MLQFAAICCVIGISVGQILFKASSKSFIYTGSYLSPKTLSLLLAALFLYGVTTIAWVWVLQKIELGKVYPYMALAFVLVPIASHFFFGENYSSNYYIGIVLIVVGILITVGVS